MVKEPKPRTYSAIQFRIQVPKITIVIWKVNLCVSHHGQPAVWSGFGCEIDRTRGKRGHDSIKEVFVNLAQANSQLIVISTWGDQKCSETSTRRVGHSMPRMSAISKACCPCLLLYASLGVGITRLPTFDETLRLEYFQGVGVLESKDIPPVQHTQRLFEDLPRGTQEPGIRVEASWIRYTDVVSF